METRALCIAFFYAIGTAAGGIAGPLLFGALIENASGSKDITKIAIGYYVGAALMIIGGVIESVLRGQGRRSGAGEPGQTADRRGRRRRRGAARPPRRPHDQLLARAYARSVAAAVLSQLNVDAWAAALAPIRTSSSG